MIGIVVVAHNEEALLGACLAAIGRAQRASLLRGQPSTVVVVLDACTDGSARIAAAHDCHVVAIEARSVGAARAAGARQALALGAHWLAFTDADSLPAADWLCSQVGLAHDAVCGCVTVDDWSAHGDELATRYAGRYEDRDGHRHVHGANLGVCAEVYRAVGGFTALRTGEDVDLVRRIEDAGYRIAWSARPRVVTSARVEGRAPEGFAAYLQALKGLATTVGAGLQSVAVETLLPAGVPRPRAARLADEGAANAGVGLGAAGGPSGAA